MVLLGGVRCSIPDGITKSGLVLDIRVLSFQELPEARYSKDYSKTGVTGLLPLHQRQQMHVCIPHSTHTHTQQTRVHSKPYPSLDHESLNLVLDGPDLAHEVTSLVGGDASRDHGAGHTSRTTQRKLAGHVDVGHVLVLSQEGQMEQDGERGGVGGQDDDFSGSAVQSLGRWERESSISRLLVFVDGLGERERVHSPSLAPFFN